MKPELSRITTVELDVPPKLLAHARELRKRQTDAEKLLWQLLRNRQLKNWKFRRQHPISLGYILDFYCVETKVAIELDGNHHREREQAEYDLNRTKTLSEYGIRVVRFPNNAILNFPETVLRKIIAFTVLTLPSP